METIYTREQFLKSKEFADHKDLISILLEKGKKYGKEEVREKINGFLKGSVH